MGYKGLVTLMYRAGAESIYSDIVRKNDSIKLVNGDVQHEVDPFKTNEERGEAIGAYVKVDFKGKTISKFMNGKDIIAHAQKFSKSYNPTGSHSPWNPKNDPELWMWKKTVLIQASKLLPTSDSLKVALNLDYQDSVLHERQEKAKKASEGMKMGNLLKPGEHEENKESKTQSQGTAEGK